MYISTHFPELIVLDRFNRFNKSIGFLVVYQSNARAFNSLGYTPTKARAFQNYPLATGRKSAGSKCLLFKESNF
jgi:hypothetical protein